MFALSLPKAVIIKGMLVSGLAVSTLTPANKAPNSVSVSNKVPN